MWTRFGNSIRHIWHEKCRRNTRIALFKNLVGTFLHPHTFFEQKELTYLSAPPSSMFIDPPQPLQPPLIVFLYSLSVSNSISFPPSVLFLAYRHPPPSIKHHYPVHHGRQRYCLLNPMIFEPSDPTQTPRFSFLRKTLFSFFFSILVSRVIYFSSVPDSFKADDDDDDERTTNDDSITTHKCIPSH